MTNRQSNIIFYIIISLIIYALIINYTNPEFFENFNKSKVELSIIKALKKGENKKALSLYKKIVEQKISDGNENTTEAATIYEDMAKLYSSLGNKVEEKNFYLKSISIKEQLKKNDVFGFANTYDKLGFLAEEEKEYNQAQKYYEKSLSQKLGNTNNDEDEGMFVGMQNTRERYLRLNNEETIATLKKLGAIHKIKKEYRIAKKYYEKALTASKETSGEDDDKTLEIMDLMNRLEL